MNKNMFRNGKEINPQKCPAANYEANWGNREFSGYFISRMEPPSGGDAHRGGLGEVEGVPLGSLFRKSESMLTGAASWEREGSHWYRSSGAVFALPWRENAHRGG